MPLNQLNFEPQHKISWIWSYSKQWRDFVNISFSKCQPKVQIHGLEHNVGLSLQEVPKLSAAFLI